MITLDAAIIILAGISTLAIFSFLLKENSVYRAFEHIFIGVAAAYIPLVTIKTFLWPEVIEPLANDYKTDYKYLLFFPIILGLFYYTIYIPRLRFLARIVIGFSLGASAGLSFQGFFAEVMPQIISSMKPLVTLNNILFVTILASTLYYFFFTIERHGKAGKYASIYARSWMMICFGAFFGSTVTARLALLVERLQFLQEKWYPTLVSSLQQIF